MAVFDLDSFGGIVVCYFQNFPGVKQTWVDSSIRDQTAVRIARQQVISYSNIVEIFLLTLGKTYACSKE